MNYLAPYFDQFNQALKENECLLEPVELYEPMNYILNLGGKRLRPIITLLSCDLFGGDVNEAIKPGMALEYFHNFTLMHDDIMDKAPLRRGKETVHIKYGVDQAILSGDAMLIKSYQLFESLDAEKFKEVISLFSYTAVTLCEGQQLDLNFEEKEVVSYKDYMDMIFYKTGALSAAAFKIGAIIAGASKEDADLIYSFGKHLGIAFQLKDDLLDVYGEKYDVGKKHAGDIIENKKTILFIKAMEKGDEHDRNELAYWFSIRTDNIDKVYGVEKIFKKLRIDKEVTKLIESETEKAKSFLDQISGNAKDKNFLYEFADDLVAELNKMKNKKWISVQSLI